MSTSRTQIAPVRGEPGVFGMLAEFENVDHFLGAVAKVREAGYTRFDTHSPIPVHGLDEAMGIRMSKLPLVVLGGGVTGALAGLALQWWANAVDYPIIVGGKSFFGLPANVPISFELTILLGALGCVGGLIVGNGWPQLYHPLFHSDRFRRATSDRFFISVEAADPLFDQAHTRALLDSLHPTAVELVEEP